MSFVHLYLLFVYEHFGMSVQAWIFSFPFCTLLLFSIYLFSRDCIFGPPGFFTVPSPIFLPYLLSLDAGSPQR